MKRLALFLYKRLCLSGFPIVRFSHVKSDLLLLHPGEQIDCLTTDYYVRKIELILKILLVGFLFGTALKISAWSSTGLGQGGGVRRGDYTEGSHIVRLQADDGEEQLLFEMEVAARQYSEKEIEELARKYWTNLDSYILGENSDRNHVTSDLILEKTYEGYPFEYTWKSNRREIIDSRGEVSEVEENTTVTLDVSLIYGDYSISKSLMVTVVPILYSTQEQNYMEIQKILNASEEQERTKQYWIPPSKWNGKNLRWSLVREDNSLLIWMITPVVAGLVFFFQDKDLHGQLEKRRKKLIRDYPDIVYKLMLYVGAGMTIRGAMQKIGSDYEKNGRNRAEDHPGYEEILITCRELQTGMSEGAAYEHMGKRTGLREYVKLSSLLGQNLKRGSTVLPQLLREEMEKVSGGILLQSKKMGEEAGTKLLFPMMLMLGIVMVLIMIPAFGAI